MLHSVTGLLTYLSILIGIELWPEHETRICFCSYSGVALFYASVLAIQYWQAMHKHREIQRSFCGPDIRSGLPGYTGSLIARDMRAGLPTFNANAEPRP
ncbi:MAG: hypothetical protein P4L57_10305 [Rhizomicrobium sp.]|nr:hypothetical protein [Rhizomicrobium sp.]